MKTAIIFGVTGQDGAYLSDLLLKKGYKVHGIVRRSSAINRYRIDKIDNKYKKNFILHYGDVTDSLNTIDLIKKIKPGEIYNLAAQSHVQVSFEKPLYTTQSIVIGALNILESIRILGLQKKVKYYQASSSEMFGNNPSKILKENSFFDPQSVYAVSKVYSYHLTKFYRNTYKIFASNRILFNHESPWRSENFVTKKIVSALVKIKYGSKKKLNIGNLYSKRDWGYAKDYVEGMWKILQYKKPDDFILATNSQISVKQFIDLVLKKLKMKTVWRGSGLKETLFYNNQTIIQVNKKYFRPAEVHSLRGDYSKAKKALKWKPKTSLSEFVEIMINYEINKIQK